MKLYVVADKKKKSYLLIADSSNSDGNSKPKTPKLISFSLFIRQVILNNLGDWNDMKDERWYHCYWWIRWIKVLTTSNNSNGNSNNKPRIPKFINFSLPIGQVILSDLQLHLWLQLMLSLMKLMLLLMKKIKIHKARVTASLGYLNSLAFHCW